MSPVILFWFQKWNRPHHGRVVLKCCRANEVKTCLSNKVIFMTLSVHSYFPVPQQMWTEVWGRAANVCNWTRRILGKIPLFRSSTYESSVWVTFVSDLCTSRVHMDSRRISFKKRERGSATSLARTQVMRDKELRRVARKKKNK